MKNGELYHLLLIIDYFFVIFVIKSLFEKTKPMSK